MLIMQSKNPKRRQNKNENCHYSDYLSCGMRVCGIRSYRIYQRYQKPQKEKRESCGEKEMICENCIYWSQCEEECTIIDMLEYDEDQFYRFCPDTIAEVTNGDKCPIEK